MKTTIEHKYNIGYSHFEIDESGEDVKEYKITKIVVINDGIYYVVSKSFYKEFHSEFTEIELKEEEINNTVEDWIKRKIQEYTDKITEIANK